MKDLHQAMGRPRLLSKIAHWQCRSKNWEQIRGLYEAIVEYIELGEEEWTSDFSHYESMVCVHIPNTESKDGDNKDKDKEKNDKDKKSTEVY